MKRVLPFLFLLTISLLATQCTEPAPEGTNISGTISEAASLQVFLDHIMINKANQVIEKTEADANGAFAFNFPEGIDPGVYRLRIGSKKVNFILEDSNADLQINGRLADLQQYNFTVAGPGSQPTQVYINTMQGLLNRQLKADDIKSLVDTVSSPLLAMYLPFQTLGRNGQFLETHKAALARAEAAYPTSDYVTNYKSFIQQTEAAYAQQMASELIKVGQPAPDISLPDPNGKNYALSELKGQVVLLDFWASWCGPCRRENPNVVKVYEKYKKQGFTVFSVSLDGLDTRTKTRLNDEAKIDAQMAASKQRWIAAIEKDGLPWEYHVSDLKKWECAPARTYGVRSIPRTFLIDREGKIAAVNLRGADAIERELLKVL